MLSSIDASSGSIHFFMACISTLTAFNFLHFCVLTILGDRRVSVFSEKRIVDCRATIFSNGFVVHYLRDFIQPTPRALDCRTKATFSVCLHAVEFVELSGHADDTVQSLFPFLLIEGFQRRC